MNKKYITWKIFGCIVVIMIIVLVVFLLQKNQKTNSMVNNQPDLTNNQVATTTSNYSNSYYRFSLSYPTGLEYCVNDMCEDGPESIFKVDGYQLSKYQESDSKNFSDTVYLEVLPRQSSLGMTAVDFAKRSLSLNRQFNTKDIYFSEGDIEFAGQKAYSFIAENGFEERSLKMEYQNNGLAAVNAPEFFEKAGEGRALGIPHKIIYFDYKGVIYRITYPVGNKIAESIVNSLRLAE